MSYTVPNLLQDVLVVSSFGAITNKAVVDILVRILWEPNVSVLQDKRQGIGLLSCVLSVHLITKEAAKLFSRVAVPLYGLNSKV